MYDAVTYDSEGDTFTAGLNWLPGERTNVMFYLAYTDSEASYNEVNYPDPAGQPGIGYYDFTQVNSYSDLDVKQWDITINGSHQFTDRFGLQLGGAYRIYEDNEVYLFDETGDLWVINAGLTFFF